MTNVLTLHDGGDALRWSLATISLLVSLGYLSLVSQEAGGLRTTFKTTSVAALAALPLVNIGVGSTFALVALAAALGFGSLGDFFLALKDGEQNFKRGIVAFLVGHLFYLAVMLPRIEMPSLLQLVGIVLLAAMAFGVCVRLGAKLGKYKKPIWAYMGVISAMALAALMLPTPWAGLGALLFVFSDTVIVVNQFGRPVPYRGPIVWITYYVGQVLIAASLLSLI